MKKLIALILAGVLVLGLVACGNDKNTESLPAETTSSNYVEYIDHRIVETAEKLGSVITSETGPYEGYWDDALTFLVEDVDRQLWPQVLNIMNWSANCLNTFNLYDSIVYTGEAWRFDGGELTISHLGEWHEIIATHNVHITQPYASWLTAEFENYGNAYLLMYAPAKGYYIIEISIALDTSLSTLAAPYIAYNYVGGSWLQNETESEFAKVVDSAEFAAGNVLFRSRKWGDKTPQEYWDESMSFLVEKFAPQDWHWLFPTFCGGIAYAENFDDINVININDLNSYGDEGNWSWSDGKFTNYDYSYIEWTYNLVLTEDTEGNTVITVDDPAKDGVMLVLLGDYYYYLIRFTDDAPTNLTNLAEHFVDEFSVIVHNE